LQARVNFKGVEKFFLKLLFTGQSFKVSFRNVLGLLVVPPTLFQVAFGHRASWALSVCGPAGLFRPAVCCCALAFLMMLFWLVLFWLGSFVFCYKGICMDHPCIQLEAFWEYGFFKV
jgi:hypothetical protein